MSRPRRTDAPLFTSVGGLHRLQLLEVNPRHQRRPNEPPYVPLPENSWCFTNLVSAINIGMEILESPTGRSALMNLGSRLVQMWGAQYEPDFRGGVNQMAFYVDHFLSRTRLDFPKTTIDTIGDAGVIALCDRGVGLWNGDLRNYIPKRHATYAFNHCRITDMVQNSIAIDRLEKHRHSEEGKKQRAILLRRHKSFQFLFAIATVHEMAHAFFGYLSHGSRNGRFATPPPLSHLDYGPFLQTFDAMGTTWQKGESGRWLENVLFGGSVEFFANNEGEGQAGVPYLIDRNDVARKIKTESVMKYVEARRQFEFPLQTTGSGITRRQREEGRIRSVGDTANPGGYTADLQFMSSRYADSFPMYNVSKNDLDRVPEQPRKVRAQPV